MSYRNNPLIQARIHQNKLKKQAELSQTARASFSRGVRAALKTVSDLAQIDYAGAYELKSEVLHRLNVIAADERMLSGANLDVEYEELLKEVKESLSEDRHSKEEEYIAVAVRFGRSVSEALRLHYSLTQIHQEELPEDRKAALHTAIAVRFPV